MYFSNLFRNLILESTLDKTGVFKKRNIKVKDSLEELDYLLKDSIKLRTRSDVDFGLYYSKGLDSSLINTYFNFKNKFFFDDSKNWKSDFF